MGSNGYQTLQTAILAVVVAICNFVNYLLSKNHTNVVASDIKQSVNGTGVDNKIPPP